MGSFVAELAAKSNIVEVVSDETDEESGASKVVLRVLDEKPWIRMMAGMIKTAHGLDDFGLEVHKVFFAQEAPEGLDVRFAWVVIHWGDPEGSGARTKLEPILVRRTTPPPPFALGKAAARAGAAPAARPRTARTPAPATEPDEFDTGEDPGEVRLRGGRAEGKHRIRHVRHVSTGDDEFDVFEIPLPHVTRLFDSKKPNEVITMASARGRFKATVRGRGEAEFNPGSGGREQL